MDIFVCTADPKMEPPTMVISTVLSAMSYNYPWKLSVNVSEMAVRSSLSMLSLRPLFSPSIGFPFAKGSMLNQEHRRPILHNTLLPKIANLLRNCWLLRDTSSVDDEGSRLPTLVYMSREKRPNWPHNFKAGALNALIRVSSEVTNAPFILNLDCDMYSSNADTIQETLCFFLDEKQGDEVAFVQLPQFYDNITENDIYGNAYYVANVIELAGGGGYGAAIYCGTACFHRRESISGEKYSKGARVQLNTRPKKNEGKSVVDLEESSKVLASCSYEKGTQWGIEVNHRSLLPFQFPSLTAFSKFSVPNGVMLFLEPVQMGLVYGCPVEDVVTGLAIQCRGWKSLYYEPERVAFLGVAPTTLELCLVQHKRWSEGLSQTFLSEYCPFTYGHGRINLGAQMAYCIYLLWAPFSLPTLYYVIVPSLCLLKGISLFPEMSSPWFVPFAYVFVAKNVFSVFEAMSCGSTLKAWWNLQRMWLFQRTTSYFIALLDIFKRKLGLNETTFILTDKVVKEDASKRYKQEIMEFGSSNIMFTILATLALLNLFTFVGGIMKTLMNFKALEQLILQIVLCGIIVLINLPVYQALFIRNDNGCIPSSVMFKSVVLASVLCLLPIY
ncbi:hypothetical protein TIFTF001_037397 [Ficus carica]|uniref:Cellulose synthase-like protein E6 n=1 Tax=Ficus carica TaxID=3494 RepID=A0AA88E588_FICCA|nr:hypothetical protein TIFTF001_037397 [Ficus carica]